MAATSAAVRTASGKPGVFDPCTLLKKEEVEAAFTQPFEDPESNVDNMMIPVAPGVTARASSCRYDAAGLTLSFVELDLSQFSGGTAEQRRQLVDFVCAKKERISGLGDSACWYDTKHDELQVVAGLNAFTLRAVKGATGDNGAIALALARQAIARLP